MAITVNLVAGSLQLEIALIKELMQKSKLIDSPCIYYKWRGTVVCGSSYQIIKERYTHVFFTIPTEYDSMMYKIVKHHKKWMTAKSLLRQINTLTYYMNPIDAEWWPPIIRDYYLNSFVPTHPDNENHDKDLAKVVVILDQLEPKLNWLHENNVLMQTL